MPRFDDPEFIRERIDFKVVKANKLTAGQNNALDYVLYRSVMAEFIPAGFTRAQVRSFVEAEHAKRTNLNKHVGGATLRDNQRFARQKVAVAVDKREDAPVAFLAFSDNASSTRELPVGGPLEKAVRRTEIEGKFRAPGMLRGRVHLLGMRAVLPELVPKTRSKTPRRPAENNFTIVDGLAVVSLVGKPDGQPFGSHPWQQEASWMRSLASWGAAAQGEGRGIRPFGPRSPIVHQGDWFGDHLSSLREAIKAKPEGLELATLAIAIAYTPQHAATDY